ncbi:MAG: hypothetical protein SangKO_025390 [Sandaracinaceae bacterium]
MTDRLDVVVDDRLVIRVPEKVEGGDAPSRRAGAAARRGRRVIPSGSRIFVCLEPQDMRRGFDGFSGRAVRTKPTALIANSNGVSERQSRYTWCTTYERRAHKK